MNLIKLAQPEKGYRYNIDSYLLALFSQFKKTEQVCDLGAGVGILSFLALQKGGVDKVTAVEVQTELSSYLIQNAQKLRLTDQLQLLQMNWKNLSKHLTAQSFDLVISNPPYRKINTGRVSQEKTKLIAKHEVEGGLEDLIQVANYLLKPSGRFCVIYPVLRLEELIQAIAKHSLKMQRMRFIHPYAHQTATHFMIEIVRSVAGEPRVEAPLIVYQDEKNYSPEVEKWVGVN
ncbi:MAG: methyltransferase [Deltaproteobacteria bacterium]|nr:methyltransferase [Deltaproteobacteria bacterium]